MPDTRVLDGRQVLSLLTLYWSILAPGAAPL